MLIFFENMTLFYHIYNLMSRKNVAQKLTKLFDIYWSLFIKMHKRQENKGNNMYEYT